MAGRRSINEGTRLTRQRQAVLNSFTEDHQHLSAEEVYQRVKEVQPRISLATVYRNLELLTRLGLLQQFSLADGTRRYELASHHHHHLVCIDCGGAQDLPGCPLNQKIRGYSRENNFTIIHHSFEIYGVCEDCSARRG